jgi:hypothetical protein
MPRRKRNRRQRLERQEQRQEATAAGVPISEEATPSPEPEPATTGSGLSFSGAAGGLLGAGMFFARATQLLIDPGADSRLWAVAFVFLGLLFLPSIWVSIVRNHPRRRRVLQFTTVGVMALAMLGSVAFGLGFAIILAPSTGLLAVGAGFIFQGSRPSS